ncbi:putative ubiquitin conjugating enzyme E2 [Aspergillus homomorphus CBS 101889]|uniref:UBC core domain-containing protein n=1 Tax=Aspergillus homomorphus (strain CBS 101889) TaxID=1450537 RepID=A0A395HSJ6_ASPHC|nr:hypothetical protein BO97DRAFT_394347 [Aspergillus homomorphus CBS 101889]RAL10516.1 hypothetical protein BO97DRAFT_394347 [Aspergillus homomorphus CBS 101889]
MVSASIRRLAADHAALHEELPPNYLFPPDDATADDLTQFTALLAGPQGTPYSQGLWRLHLKMPEDYPKSPPKATFKTRIWHPNVEELTGAVCVDTLKRDWKPSLTLKDVLITISCLLIYPNPDSALNSASGSLLQENYEAFARQAKLMTSIHAPVPDDLKNAVAEARLRGEDAGTTIPVEQEESRTLRPRKGTRVTSVTMKKRTTRKTSARTTPESEPNTTTPTIPAADQHQQPQPAANNINEEEEGDESLSDSESSTNASKENDPSLSPSPVRLAPPSTFRKNIHGKRPLSVLTLPLEMDDDPSTPSPADLEDDNNNNTPSTSDQNIAANHQPRATTSPPSSPSSSSSSSPTSYYYTTKTRTTPLPTTTRNHQETDQSLSPQQPRSKSPKLSIPKRGGSPIKGINASGRIRDDFTTTTATAAGSDLQIFEDPSSSDKEEAEEARRRRSGEGKENPLAKNLASSSAITSLQRASPPPPLSSAALGPPSATTSRRAVSACLPSGSKPLRSSMPLGARKVSASAGGTAKKAKPRIGIRRL